MTGQRCPKCGPTKLEEKSGEFKVGEALIWHHLVGLIAGLLSGSPIKNDLKIFCLDCKTI